MTVHSRPWWRRAGRLVATVLVALCALLGAAAPVAAHAELVSTDPVEGAVLDEAPEAVTLSFNEPVRLTDRRITVYDADGVEVESEATTSGSDVVVDLPDPGEVDAGTFVVAWFVLSGDGHPISGSLTFSVGEPSASVAEPPPPPTSSRVVTTTQGVLSGVLYAGLLVGAGLVAFLLLVLPERVAGERVRRRVRRVVLGCAAAATLAALLLVPVSAAYAQGLELSDVVGGFDPALVSDEVVAAALVVLGLGVVAALLQDVPPGPRRRPLLLAATGLSLAAPARVGHSRSYGPQELVVAADLVHVVAGAVWLGGLVGLVLALPALAGREAAAASTLGRFSSLAGGLLLAVAAAGAYLGWRVMGSWGAFVETRYGLLLLVKIGLALVVAAIGAGNRFILVPRVRASAGFADRHRSTGLVRRAVTLEASVIVVLLAVTGFLVNQSPRPAPVEVPPGQTGVQEGSLGQLEVLAVMTPRRQGSNTLLVQVQDASGEPVTPPRTPQVSLRSGEVDLGAVRLVNADVGTYRAEVVLPRGGTWEVQVGLRLSRFESPVTTVRFEVAEE
ncbi:MAG TPA: copper resistance protein CopC [Nocardioides sp.]|nr:copper resistance protein CopC [Nocardioides sp.]